jgi:hypothetical protein
MQAQAPSLIPRTKYSIEEVGSRTQRMIVFIFRFGHKKSRCQIFLTFSPSSAVKIAKLQGKVFTEQQDFEDEDGSTRSAHSLNTLN